MKTTQTVRGIWIALSVLFAILAAFHFYLALTAKASLEIPAAPALFGGQAGSLTANQQQIQAILAEITRVVKVFIDSYHHSMRWSSFYAGCGYLVASLTSCFCFLLSADLPAEK